MHIAQRMERLGTETAFEVLAKAKALEAAGHEIIHLEIGEPDFDTPKHIVEAGIEALRAGYTHYSPAAGIPELREAIAEDVERRRGVRVNPANVVVTPGAKPIMFFTILACIEQGDEVIYPNPGFPIYESVIDFVGGKSVPLRLREQNDFRFEIDELRSLVNNRTRMIILNSPQNPTGGVLARSDLEAVAEIAREHNLWVLSDEVYKNILYDAEHESILSLPGMMERTILLDGFSKTYAMTGWRLGFGVMPQPLASHVERLMINSNSCTATFTQKAGVAALRGPQDETFDMVAEFRRRRDVMVQGLNDLPGVRCKLPLGAFYVFPNVKDTGVASRELAAMILEKAGVAVLAGNAFGEFGDGYLRLSYANSIENIRKGIERIGELLNTLPAD
jgi:aspartate/methionine/tyrosine aminotransferase